MLNCGEGSGAGRKFARKHHVCKKTAHVKKDYSDMSSGNDCDDVNDLGIGMIEVEGDDIEVNNAQLPARNIDVLGHAGAQGHAKPPHP